MPCRSYEDDDYYKTKEINKLKESADKLARISCKILNQLEESKAEELLFLILKDKETADWWSVHKEADRKAKAEEVKRQKKAAEKVALICKKNEIKARLTPEELKILGVK